MVSLVLAVATIMALSIVGLIVLLPPCLIFDVCVAVTHTISSPIIGLIIFSGSMFGLLRPTKFFEMVHKLENKI